MLIKKIFLFCALIMVNIGLNSTNSLIAKEAGEFVPDELVCQFIAPLTIDSLNNQFGTSTGKYLSQLDSYLLETDPGVNIDSLVDEILALPEVVYCEPNFLLDAPEPVQSSQPFLDQEAVGTFEDQFSALTLNIPDANILSTGSSVGVAVIDAGINMTHPALSSTTVSGFDYVDNDPIAEDVTGTPATGHGTFVSGVIKLVAPGAISKSYRVLDTAGSGNGYTIAEAVLQAIEDSCKVINLSIVMNGKHPTLDDAVEFARNNNVIVVAAAGNDGDETEKFPASDSYTLSVAGLDTTNHKADFSNYNNKVDVCAPSTAIYAPYIDSSYAWWDGTSFAAPFVAGLAALLFEVNPDATWNDIVDVITQTAIDIDSLNPAFEGLLGYGLIDPVAALEMFGAFKCGDVDNDSEGPYISDLTYFVNYIFKGGLPPVHLESANVDGIGDMPNITDLVYLVNYIFKGGPDPVCSQ